MTYREKLVQEHPELRSVRITDAGCPKDYGYEPAHSCAVYDGKEVDCKDCWSREIPEEKPKFEHRGKPIAKVKDIYEENGGITAVIEPTIKDSGNRTEFATGAVRDIQKGKGRCDLMPLRVAAMLVHGDTVLDCIGQFQDTGDTMHLYDALRHFVSAFNGLADMLLEVAKHFEEGADKYGPDNWKKGIPVERYIDSATRHYLKCLRIDNDEPHARAFVWNVMCCIWEVDYSPRAKGENDIPPKHVIGKVAAEVVTKCGDTVVYLCDGKACEKCDNPDCKHTHDIRHAVNFESVDNGVFGKTFFEKYENEEEESPDKWVRLEDCPTGLFEFGGKLYLKAGSTVVHVNTGTVEPLHPDILVWPITIEEDADA